MCSRLGTLFLLLLTVVRSGTAQGTRLSDAGLRLRETLRALRDSQMVRSVTDGSGRSEGRVLEHSDTSLVLATQDRAVRFPSGSVDTLWVRGTSLKKGLVWGAGVGTLAGLAFGVIVNQTYCTGLDSGCDDEDARVMLATGLSGLASGIVVGSIIGALIPTWHRRWP
jgi:hypothetical protein